MRRSLLVAALLATTALTPTQADAAPVVAWVAGAIGVAGGAAIAGTAAYAAGAAFVGTVWGAFAVRTVLSIGLAALATSLGPKASMPPPSARMVNFAQPVSYAEWVFGRSRKGGPIGFTGFSNLRRYYVPILAAHPIEGVVEHWLDERVVTLNGEADQDLSNIVTAPITGYGRINSLTGGAGQTVDAGLDAAFTEITAAHDFKGLAGAVIWAKRPPASAFTDIYPRSRQWAYAPVIDGNNQIYDPRDDSRKFTNNGGLVIAHWITEVLGREVDWSEVAVEANASDPVIINREGGTQAKWMINGSISDEQEFEDQRAQLVGACDAFIYEKANGKVGFKVGRWIEPTVTLTADDFYALEITEGNWGAGAPSEVAVTYTEPENAWRETPGGTWVEDAATKPIRDEPQLFMVTNHNQSARMAKRIAKTKRAQYKLRGTFGLIGYELLEQRFVRVVHAEMGIDAYFEVGELAKDSGVFTLSANSVRPEDFDFDAAIEEPTRPVYTSVTSNDDIAETAGLGALAVEGGGLDFTLDAADESYTQQLRIQVDGETDWQVFTVPDGQGTLRVTGLIDGATYLAQARNRTAALRVGDWKPDEPYEVTVVANGNAPAALDAFTATLSGSDMDLAFTAPNDANYFATRIYRATDSTDFANAALIRTEYGIPSSADAWTDPSPGAGDQSYWAEPVNPSGISGARTGPTTVTIT